MQVVGAPCGIMDQIASSLGHAGKLLALLCQPAEVVGHVTIPHQVGGARGGGRDLGGMRVGVLVLRVGVLVLNGLGCQEG
jgi:L-arabinokinase